MTPHVPSKYCSDPATGKNAVTSCSLPLPSEPPSPPLQPLENAYCIQGESPLFTSVAEAMAHSPVGAATAAAWNLGNGHSYWKPDGYPGATSVGGPCLDGTTLELIPVHLLPKHACGGPTGNDPARYPYSTAAEAEAGCSANGCTGGLAPASVMNSPWFAWKGKWAALDNSTAVRQMCYAAWYVNDIGFVGDGGVAHTHEQLYYMHDANPVAGCGNQGMNHWDGAGDRSAAACLGCPYHLDSCPSPPPASPPPPPEKPPPTPPLPTHPEPSPPPPSPQPHTPVVEPTIPTTPAPTNDGGLEPATVTLLIVAGAILGVAVLMMIVSYCCGAGMATAATIDCERPPDRERYPAEYARWLRECKDKRRDQVAKVIEMRKASETAALISFAR